MKTPSSSLIIQVLAVDGWCERGGLFVFPALEEVPINLDSEPESDDNVYINTLFSAFSTDSSVVSLLTLQFSKKLYLHSNK